MAEIGDNSKLTPDEEKALKMSWFLKYQEKMAILKAANTEVKKITKLAKADGIMTKDLRFMAQCAEVEDPSIIPDMLKRQIEMATWFALPIGYEADMFVDREPIDDKAYRMGVDAGMLGKNPVGPYAENSTPGQRFLAGWHDGQKKLAADMQSAMEKKQGKAPKEQPVPETTDAPPEVKAETTDADWDGAAPETVPETPAPVPPKPRARSKKDVAAVH